MLTSDQFDQLQTEIEPLYDEFQQTVINDIARRLVNLDFSSAAWQAQRLQESGELYQNILKELAKTTGKSEKEIATILAKYGVKAIQFDDKIYKQAGLEPTPLKLSPAMLQTLKAGLVKTNGVVNNLTKSTAITAQQSFIHNSDLAYLQVSSGAMSYTQAIRTAIKNVAANGLETIDFASGHRDSLDVAMRRTVLTGVAQTANQLQITRADEMGSDLVAVSAHAGARNKGTGPENHQSWQGKIYSRSGNHKKFPDFVTITGYGTGEGLGGWNCVIGETRISGQMPLIGYRRKYSGELITFRTALGKELTITPNHPVLTAKGWVAAGLLTEGDNVICRRVRNGATIISPNNNQRPTTIENIFNSLWENNERLIFSGSPKDFHGDGSNSKIDIVFTDSFLRNNINAFLHKHFIQNIFRVPSRFAESFVCQSAFPQIAISFFATSNSIVSSLGQSRSFFAGHSSKSSPYNFLTASKMTGNLAFEYPAFIELDKIVFVQREFSQTSFIHVYNLETEGNWYFANDIMTHNCRHSFYPYFEGLSEKIYDEATLRGYRKQKVSYNGQKISMYDATQYQREIERKIRLWKRQAEALEATGLDNSQEVAKVSEWQARMRDFVNDTRLDRQREREQVI